MFSKTPITLAASCPLHYSPYFFALRMLTESTPLFTVFFCTTHAYRKHTDGVDDTQEIFLPLGLDTFLSPSLTVYKDIDNAPSWFLFGYFSCVRDHGKGLLGTFRIDQLLAERRQFYLWWGNREHGLLGKILISGFSVG